jgi:hypothetical protein
MLTLDRYLKMKIGAAVFVFGAFALFGVSIASEQAKGCFTTCEVSGCDNYFNCQGCNEPKAVDCSKFGISEHTLCAVCVADQADKHICACSDPN